MCVLVAQALSKAAVVPESHVAGHKPALLPAMMVSAHCQHIAHDVNHLPHCLQNAVIVFGCS